MCHAGVLASTRLFSRSLYISKHDWLRCLIRLRRVLCRLFLPIFCHPAIPASFFLQWSVQGNQRRRLRLHTFSDCRLRR
jgi:hypothetical protein